MLSSSGPWLSQKQRQIPMLEQIGDRHAQSRVRLHSLFVELCTQPRAQLSHDRGTVGLVKREPLYGRHVLLAYHCIIRIDCAEAFQYEPARFGEVG